MRLTVKFRSVKGEETTLLEKNEMTMDDLESVVGGIVEYSRLREGEAHRLLEAASKSHWARLEPDRYCDLLGYTIQQLGKGCWELSIGPPPGRQIGVYPTLRHAKQAVTTIIESSETAKALADLL